MILIERDLLDSTLHIELNEARNLHHLAHHTVNSELFKLLIDLSQIVACPDHQVMRELPKEDQHLLRANTRSLLFLIRCLWSLLREPYLIGLNVLSKGEKLEVIRGST
jgi:hypothetical protein